MTRIELYAVGDPAPQGSHRYVGNGVMIESSKRVKPWRRQVAAAARDAMVGRELLTGPVSVTAIVRLPRPKNHYGTGRNADRLKPSAPRYPTSRALGDADKHLRSLLDGMTGAVYEDDSQVVAVHLYKQYADGDNPVGAHITIDTLEEVHP